MRRFAKNFPKSTGVCRTYDCHESTHSLSLDSYYIAVGSIVLFEFEDLTEGESSIIVVPVFIVVFP